MGNPAAHKSLSRSNKFRAKLLSSLIHDIYNQSEFSNSTMQRDLLTLHSRLLNEGSGFVTKVLPSLGKAFDSALETSTFFIPPGFKAKKGTKLPAFLHGIFQRVFSKDGSLLDLCDLGAVSGIRQICYLFYKEEFPKDLALEAKATKNFKDNDDSLVREYDVSTDLVLHRASLLLGELLQDFTVNDYTPRHGPGGVATRERMNEKFSFKRKYAHVHRLFPYYQYFMVGMGRELVDRFSWYKALQPLDYSTARCVFVPKDSRGPRTISMEPLEIQWIQQMVRRSLYSHVEHHPLTKGFVNFTDQGINQSLALQGSITRSWATIDLKDASDLVSWKLVKAIFPDHFVEVLEASRSRYTELPDGSLVELKKFAPMGSALCFPVLALTLWALSSASVMNCDRIGRRQIYVYGDDIVVPSTQFETICEALENYELRINRTKSYSRGYFRESCGVDAFRGCDVTPHKVRKSLCVESVGELAFPPLLTAYTALRKGLYLQAAKVCLDEAKSIRKVPYGLVTSGFPCIQLDNAEEVATANIYSHVPSRWNRDYQRLEYLVWCEGTRKVVSSIGDWERLLRYCTSNGGEPELFSVPTSRLRRRWRTA